MQLKRSGSYILIIRKTEGRRNAIFQSIFPIWNFFARRTRFFFGDQILLTGRCKFPEQSRPCFLHEFRPRMWKGSDLARKFFFTFRVHLLFAPCRRGVQNSHSCSCFLNPKPANKRKKRKKKKKKKRKERKRKKKKKSHGIIPKPNYVSYFQAPHKPSPNLPGTPPMDDGLYPAIFPLR